MYRVGFEPAVPEIEGSVTLCALIREILPKHTVTKPERVPSPQE
jgi:hypothetical protein